MASVRYRPGPPSRRPYLFALVALLVLGACGRDSGPENSASLQGMLRVVPDTQPNRRYLVYGNLDRLRGEAPPGDAEADLDTVFDASKGSFLVASPLRDHVANHHALEREAGFGLPDIDASPEAGQPPDTLSVFAGRFDGGRIDEALTGTAAFANQVQTAERDEATTYAVGEEGTIDAAGVSPLRPIGQSLRIGVDDSTVWFTNTDTGLERALDAAAGDAPALAADAAYAGVARAIDEAGAFNAVLLGDPSQFIADASNILGPGATPEQAAEAQERIDAGTLGLGPWLVAGLADAPGELLVVLWHADGEAAQDNAERLRRIVEEGTSVVTAERWSDRLSVAAIDVEGTMVVGRLRSDVPIANGIVVQRDNLIMIAQ